MKVELVERGAPSQQQECLDIMVIQACFQRIKKAALGYLLKSIKRTPKMLPVFLLCYRIFS